MWGTHKKCNPPPPFPLPPTFNVMQKLKPGNISVSLLQVFTSWRNLCPSRSQLAAQYPTPNRRTARVVSSESGRDSPTTPRSFLPVPVGNTRRSASDCWGDSETSRQPVAKYSPVVPCAPDLPLPWHEVFNWLAIKTPVIHRSRLQQLTWVNRQNTNYVHVITSVCT